MNIFKTKMKNPKIGLICVIVLAISIVSFLLAYLVKPQEWSWASLFLNLAIALFQLFWAILIVNVYLVNEERRKQNDLKNRRTIILYNTVLEPIKSYNNCFNNIIVKFGTDKYNGIIEECQKNNAYTDKMPQDEINKLIEALRPNYDKLLCEINNTADMFQIVISTGILNDDLNRFAACIIALRCCTRLNSLDINESEDQRMVFRENAIFYGKVNEIIYDLHDIAENYKLYRN